jgi:uncharacterized protein (DUF885 family)
LEILLVGLKERGLYAAKLLGPLASRGRRTYEGTLRYSCDMPSQALAYKMGMRKLVSLREKARKALGTAFDIRKFHDTVPGTGSIPLDVLEKHVDWFIAREKGTR